MSTTATLTAAVPQRRVMSLQAIPPRASSLKAEARFGQYILGQTLGEGEFGKVKLGWPAIRNGTNADAQVAIKLIRKESVGSSRSRIIKIEREINVLKRVNHPNIVKCHEVVETEKYIGIILEYASGGELFDYILAHRYLRDPVASKLFAQLISAVHYLHVRGIVHRDLKLENLLLDRNRNIIITDFGFANTFEAQQSLNDAEAMKKHELLSGGKVLGDLMQTSCGSPCYAAPELVVGDGFYCGRKVDVWSCGVILYAMLAGYLPFDDDPSNPEGDNISLLYQYIVSTPLTFPEYVGPQARDLLRRVLIPDPRSRALLSDIICHPWLEPHKELLAMASNTSGSLHKSTQVKVGSQDMIRSSSERTAAYTSALLPATSHLVPTGFAKNTSMAPPSLPVNNKRHTVQIEYEKPLINTVRVHRQGERQETAESSEESAVARLSIAAAPSMARSASHSGAQNSAKHGQTGMPASEHIAARLPTPEVKPRPTSYHPSIASSAIFEDDEATRPNVLLSSSGSVKDKRQSWSRGSIATSKTASPRSTIQNVTGEMVGVTSEDNAVTIARSHSISTPQVSDQQFTRARRQHKRNSSSISSVFGRLWSGATTSDEPTLEPSGKVRGMNVINEIDDAGNMASESPSKQAEANHHKNRSSLAVFTSRLFLPGSQGQEDPHAQKVGDTSMLPPAAGRLENIRKDVQGSKKSAMQSTKASERASSSAARRVMDFFSGRRKYKNQDP